MSANKAMTFYGQEKVEYNVQLCLMNMAVHGLTGVISPEMKLTHSIMMPTIWQDYYDKLDEKRESKKGRHTVFSGGFFWNSCLYERR
jgi:type I restriction-modification system DNA methylase subunit